MFCERKKYVQFRKVHIPKHPILKNKYCLDKISECNDSLVKQVQESNAQLQQFLKALSIQSMDTKQILQPRQNWKKEWIQLYEKAYHRGIDDCPICIHPVLLPKQPHQHMDRKVYLLSCSHTVHATCLKSLEKFTESKSCPVCRMTDYKRKLVGR
jgi:hypothetical protein